MLRLLHEVYVVEEDRPGRVAVIDEEEYLYRGLQVLHRRGVVPVRLFALEILRGQVDRQPLLPLAGRQGDLLALSLFTSSIDSVSRSEMESSDVFSTKSLRPERSVRTP